MKHYKINKKVNVIDWSASAADKNGYDDYMLKEIFEQLHDYPEQAIDGSVVSLINKVISQYVCMESTVFNCKNLREFIIYLHNRYPSMKFVDSDFSNLHSMLKEEEPGMRCYF